MFFLKIFKIYQKIENIGLTTLPVRRMFSSCFQCNVRAGGVR